MEMSIEFRPFSASSEQMLRQAYLAGSVAVRDRQHTLVKAGILAKADWMPGRRLVLDPRHPASDDIRELLRGLTGVEGAAAPDAAQFNTPHVISPDRPLAKGKQNGIRILMTLLTFGPLTRKEIQSRNRDTWGKGFYEEIDRFVSSGCLVDNEGVISVSGSVPAAYRRFVERVWAALEGTDHRYPPFQANTSTSRAWAYRNAEDGAPRIFGTDARLRHLMALAKHGPLYLLELRRIVGRDSTHKDDKDNAPLSRANMALTWGEAPNHAAMLDPRFPLHEPFCRFLLAMEKAYPLPLYIPRREAPTAPDIAGEWFGDRHWIFGGTIATAILASIGVLGWTFEALCVSVASHNRVVVKKAIKRLEAEGVLQGDRARKPGFNVRRLTIAENCPAREELIALLKAYAVAFPQITNSVEKAMAQLDPRTKEHLRRRGLIACECHPEGGHTPSRTAEYLASMKKRRPRKAT